MGNDKNAKSSLGEKSSDQGLKPAAAAATAAEELAPANEERSLDIGESGQFAPGGRYNELNATAPRRIDLDAQVDSALKNEEK